MSPRLGRAAWLVAQARNLLFAYSPRTTAVVQQADALLARDDAVNNGVSHSHADNDPPSRVHVRSVEVRRIPIRLWRTTAEEDTGENTREILTPQGNVTRGSRAPGGRATGAS